MSIVVGSVGVTASLGLFGIGRRFVDRTQLEKAQMICVAGRLNQVDTTLLAIAEFGWLDFWAVWELKVMLFSWSLELRKDEVMYQI
jgi:hypothetical protein